MVCPTPCIVYSARNETYHGFPEMHINYISHIHKKKPTCGIVKHFLLKEGHSVWDLEIMGIIQLQNPPKSKKAIKAKLKESEAHWQIRLKTTEPFGMNLICEYL